MNVNIGNLHSFLFYTIRKGFFYWEQWFSSKGKISIPFFRSRFSVFIKDNICQCILVTEEYWSSTFFHGFETCIYLYFANNKSLSIYNGWSYRSNNLVEISSIKFKHSKSDYTFPDWFSFSEIMHSKSFWKISMFNSSGSQDRTLFTSECNHLF